jgi:aldehyde:ferredoxin oxidoreductase
MADTKKQTTPDTNQTYGYAGKILRVDLSDGVTTAEILDESVLRKYIGGATLGIKYIYDEVPPGIEWSAPENRLFIGTGPLGGTRVGGSGGFAVVTKGALTNGMTSTQAQGFFGAFLRLSGFDAIILQGAASKWTYLHISEGTVELRDAGHLIGKNTHEAENMIKQELQKTERGVSVLNIGPAGEKLVRFAAIFADFGHVAAHNGVGAVMGSKKLKAIAVERGKKVIPLKDRAGVSRCAKELLTNALNGYGRMALETGTIGPIVGPSNKIGGLPVKNYTTSIHVIDPDKLEAYSPKSIREKFEPKPNPCWACTAKHCHIMRITEGKYAGRVVEEPEGEGMSEFSSNVGIDDVTTSIVLNDEVDCLGLDINEAGWVISWVMECYEKGILKKGDTDGLEMTWGDGEAIMAMLNKIANRDGFGNILAEGVMRAARHIGGQAPGLAIHTMKGNTPRGHDHRYMWLEMFDTCVSNTGTLEAHSVVPFEMFGLSRAFDRFDPEMVSTVIAKIKGAMLFEDSMVTCRYNTATALDLMCQVINAATGWNMNVEEALTVGRRAVNLARAFNLRQGISVELDAPSIRYGSTPLDGERAGYGIMPHWNNMLHNYYNLMGWDEETGKPLPQTLSNLDLDFVISELW